MLRLRPYKECDANVIASWIKDEFGFRQWSADRYDHYPVTGDDINAHYGKLSDADWFYPMTAFDESGVTGHMIMRFTDEEKKVLRFGFVIVDADKRGQGYGKEMLSLALSYAFGILKAQKVTLGVFENNPAARYCYLAAGFRDVPTEQAEYYHVLEEDWKCLEMEADARSYRSLALDLIMQRRSYRGRYKADPVPREDLVTIMEAGLAAPSGCNRQTTSLIAVDDPVVLEKLRAVIDPPVGETAPALICVLTQRIYAYRDKCFAVQDYSAAIENMLLAIEALGYRSCWYEGHITDDDRIGYQMAQILGVPDEYELVCMLPVGIPGSKPKAPVKKSFDERAWFNSFKK